MPDDACKSDPMLTAVERVMYLKAIDLLSDLPGEHLLALASVCREERRDADEAIVEQGETGDAAFILIQGSANLVRSDLPVGRISQGESFAELALIDAIHHSTTIVAETEIQLLALSRDDFRAVAIDRPEIALGMLQRIAKFLQSHRPNPL